MILSRTRIDDNVTFNVSAEDVRAEESVLRTDAVWRDSPWNAIVVFSAAPALLGSGRPGLFAVYQVRRDGNPGVDANTRNGDPLGNRA